jgi:hypothetical protein
LRLTIKNRILAIKATNFEFYCPPIISSSGVKGNRIHSFGGTNWEDLSLGSFGE